MAESENKRSDRPDFEDLISTKEAASLSGFTQEHVALLLRRGEMWGKKIGRNWVTTKQAVQEYLSRDRRPGPKKDQNA
jgi:excisionase family DNA binding protein